MAIDIEVSIWLASKTRWVHLVKTIALPVMPRVGEYLKFRNAEQGDYIPWKVTQVTYREGGETAVWTELLDNIDDRGYSFEEEAEFDSYLQSYLAEGWNSGRGIVPNRRYKKA
jgi:hypothetical protein